MSDNFFIANDIFELQTLTGFQGLGIHAAESNLLRTELTRVVEANFSPENWTFLQKIHAINQQTHGEKADLQSQLVALAATYIIGSKEQLNLSDGDKKDLLSKLSSPDLSVNDFLPVVNEVFHNLLVKNFSQHDLEVFNNAEQLINATSKIAQQISILQRDTKPEHTVSFFNRSTQAGETRIYVEANTVAAQTQTDLYRLLNEPKVTLSEYKEQFSNIMTTFNKEMCKIKMQLHDLEGGNEKRMGQFNDSLASIAKTEISVGTPQPQRSAFTTRR